MMVSLALLSFGSEQGAGAERHTPTLAVMRASLAGAGDTAEP